MVETVLVTWHFSNGSSMLDYTDGDVRNPPQRQCYTIGTSNLLGDAF